MEKSTTTIIKTALTILLMVTISLSSIAQITLLVPGTECNRQERSFPVGEHPSPALIHGTTEAEAIADLARWLPNNANNYIRNSDGSALPPFPRFCPPCPDGNLEGCDPMFINLASLFVFTPNPDPNNPNTYIITLQDKANSQIEWRCDMCALDTSTTNQQTGAPTPQVNPDITDEDVQKCGDNRKNKAFINAGGLNMFLVTDVSNATDAKNKFINQLKGDNGNSFQLANSPHNNVTDFGCPKCPDPSTKPCEMNIINNLFMSLTATKIGGSWYVGRNSSAPIKVVYKCENCPTEEGNANDPNGGGNNGDGTTGSGTTCNCITDVLPNPSSGNFTVEFELLMQMQDIRVQLLDINGNLVFENFEGVLNAGMHNSAFNLSGLVPGQYNIHLLSGGGFLHAFPIIIY